MYGIIHDSIFSSSLLEGTHPDQIHTAYVFMCLNVIADSDDNVVESRDVLCAMFRVARGTFDRAIEELEAPDESSRTPDHDGRRLIRLHKNRDWGWHIANRGRYKRLRTAAERREYQHQKYEERKSLRRNGSTLLNIPQQSSTHSTKAVGSRKKAVGKRQEAERHVDGGMRAVEPFDTSTRLGPSGHPPEKTRMTGRLHDPVVPEHLPDGEITAEQAFHQVFWPRYPRKVAKLAAERAWKALKIRNDDQSTLEAIMAGLSRDMKAEWVGRDAQAIPHASTWLNQRRWEDER